MCTAHCITEYLFPLPVTQAASDIILKVSVTDDYVITLLLAQQERRVILQAMKRKAELVYERMNQIPGVHCNKIQGAMYAFPRIDIPEEAWEDAKVSSCMDVIITYRGSAAQRFTLSLAYAFTMCVKGSGTCL